MNVRGHNLPPMAQLQVLLGKLGASEVRTYIQSSNVVFRHAGDDASELAQPITRAVAKAHGFAPRVLLLIARADPTALLLGFAVRGWKTKLENTWRHAKLPLLAPCWSRPLRFIPWL
jgi:hypothetical protein